MAPTGQCAAHWPQRTQGLSSSLSMAAGAMQVSSPRPMNSRAKTPCRSWQTCTQRPHLMHFSGSNTIDADEVSFSRSLRRTSKGCSRMPNSAAMFCNSHSPLRMQERQLEGCVDRISSRMVLRASNNSRSWVMTLRPSLTGAAQARMIFALPSCFTMHRPQEPKGLRSSW
ncbi:hypothetical protein DSECCO2_650660 [anaerobic digester metagenome]